MALKSLTEHGVAFGLPFLACAPNPGFTAETRGARALPGALVRRVAGAERPGAQGHGAASRVTASLFLGVTWGPQVSLV